MRLVTSDLKLRHIVQHLELGNAKPVSCCRPDLLAEGRALSTAGKLPLLLLNGGLMLRRRKPHLRIGLTADYSEQPVPASRWKESLACRSKGNAASEGRAVGAPGREDGILAQYSSSSFRNVSGTMRPGPPWPASAALRAFRSCEQSPSRDSRAVRKRRPAPS